ncbi:RNB-domain-containing protein [Trametes polyzona]|nr:RNB-domain-containing protein [Trametes polyzona]
MEKLAFEATDPSTEMDEFADGTDPDSLQEIDERFPAGTFVEVRRNNVRAFGVVLYTVLLDRKWIVHSLTHRGEVWPHAEHDVHFQMPGFVPLELAEKCGVTLLPHSQEERSARVEVSGHLRNHLKEFEKTMQSILEATRSVNLYDLVAHPDGKTWTQVTSREAAEKLLETQNVSSMQLLAVQSYLLEQSVYFLAEQRRFLKKQTFWVRPREDVEIIAAVHKMSSERDPALDAFVEKARAIVLAARKRLTESYHEPPSRHPLEGFEFTEKDRKILRFLRTSLRAMRHIQTDPFNVQYSQILKKIGLYDVDLYDDSSVYQLLSEMGVLAPWEETVTRIDAPEDEKDLLSLRPPAPTPLLPDPMGPHDLYRRDLVDDLRHDFGDMPAYVIDDWGAEELDDGVSIERIPSDPNHVWLHVHIADPTTLLPPTHVMSREAFRLGTSSYLLDRTIRMLPPDAGFHQYSLGNKPGHPDKTLTFSCKVNQDGDIVDYKVRPGILRNVKTLLYDVVDAALGTYHERQSYPFDDTPPSRPPLDTSSIDATALEDLRLLKKTTHNIMRSRVKKGAITICLPMNGLEVNPRPLPEELFGTSDLTPYAFRGFPQIRYSIFDTREVGAHLIISESMKSACRVASLFFRDRGIPALRRSVGKIQSERVGGLERVMERRDEDGFVDFYVTIQYLVSAPPGRYLTTPGPHSTLGIPEGEGYIKVTSPLRRFGDLFAHWQIKHALLAERGDVRNPVLFPEDWLAQFGEDLETRELVSKRIERVQNDYWAHLFFQWWMADPKAGERAHDPMRSLTGRVLTMPNLNSRTKDHNCQVYIPQLAVKAVLEDLSYDKGLGLGDEVNVKVDHIKLGVRPMLGVVLR